MVFPFHVVLSSLGIQSGVEKHSGLTHWGRDKWTPFIRRHFKSILLNENVRLLIKISLKFVPKGPINKIPALVQIMAWRRPGDKPLSEPMMVRLLAHLWVTRPQWVDACAIFTCRKYEPQLHVIEQQKNTKHSKSLTVNDENTCIQNIQCRCLLVTWWNKEPGHHQPWYWHVCPNYNTRRVT